MAVWSASSMSCGKNAIGFSPGCGKSKRTTTAASPSGGKKRELEDRVASLTEQFAKLATIRKDIARLFDKISGAVSASAN